MKKIIFLLFALAALSCSSDDDSNATTPESTVFVGDIEIEGQEAFDALVAKKYTRIEGNLYIRGYVDNLNGLETLTEVTGKFIIWNIKNIDGLKNLKNVGNLSIGKSELTNLDALEKLTIVGTLSIIDNEQLEDISGLHNLTTVNDIDFRYNTKLLSLTGLEGVTTAGNISFFYVSFSNLSGLKNLVTAQSIKIQGSGATMFPSIEGLEKLKTLNVLHLQLTRLVNLHGLEGLEHVEYITMVDNKLITSLEGLENLKDTNYIKLTSNNLTSIAALNGLNTLGHDVTNGGIEISLEGDLTTLDGLENITQFKGSVIVRGFRMRDFCALKNILENGELNTVVLSNYNIETPSVEDIIAGNCTVD